MRECLLSGRPSPITFTLGRFKYSRWRFTKSLRGCVGHALNAGWVKSSSQSDSAIVRMALQLVKGASRTTNSSVNGDLILLPYATILYIADFMINCAQLGLLRVWKKQKCSNSKTMSDKPKSLKVETIL